MSTRIKIIIAAVVAIPALALGWWLGSPLLFDREVDEEFPLAAAAEIPEGMTAEEVEAEMEEAAEAPPVEVTEEMPEMPESGPVVLASGEFRDADEFHQGSGTATIYELEDGSRVLRLEDFEVTNGPDLHVMLVPHEDPQTRDDVAGCLDLGQLKGNVGNQNYEIPPDVDLSQNGSVIIYCVPFHVLFAVAPLTP